MKHKIFSAIVILSLLLGLASSAQPVDKARAAGTCYVDDTASGTTDGLSWTNAFNDLQTALGQPECTRIDVAEGTYYPSAEDRAMSFQLNSNVGIYGGFPSKGGDTPDPIANVTILSGDIGVPEDNIDNSYHVVTGSDVNDSAVLDGFTIEAGNANASELNLLGGGIYIENGNPTLRNLVIQNNEAASNGGGMYAIGNANLYDVLFRNNQASNDGGGLYISSGAVTIGKSQFRSNWAGSAGGGLCVYGTVNMSDSIVNINTAGNEGGGIALPSIDSSGIFINLLLNYNQVSADSGYGGGVYTYGAPSTMFINTLFFDNHGANGGAMANFGGSAPIITNATIVGNWASNYGDVFYNYEANPTLTNTIFWTNEGSIPGNPDIFNPDSYSVTNISHSIVPGSCPTGANCTDVITSDPLFLGGHRFELQPTSPAIDAGDNSAVPAGITTDLDRRPRFSDVASVADSGIGTAPIVDLGAFEAHYGTPYILYVDQSGPGPLVGDGNSWATAYPDLQSALFTAYAGDQIWVAEGTYHSIGDPGTTFSLLKDVEIYGGYPQGGYGPRDPVAHETILNGEYCNPLADACSYSYHVVTGSDVDATAVLDGFTIVNGRAVGAETDGQGGGIFLVSSSPTLRNLVIEGNRAGSGGGGLFSDVNSSPTLNQVAFIHNSATQGGGYYSTGSPHMTNVDFTNNQAYEGGGMVSDGNASLTNVTFISNQATNEGNLYGDGGGLLINSGNATISDTQFISNTSYSAGGGLLINSGSATISDTKFISNRTESNGGNGGGIFNAGTANFTNVTFSSNEAFNGGGFYNLGSSTLTGIEFNNNYARWYGGGMYSGGNASLTNVAFKANKSGILGGGLSIISGNVTIRDSQFANNDATYDGGGLQVEAGSVNMIGSLFESNTAGGAGGGIALSNSSGSFVNLTVKGNFAGVETGSGGGIYTYATPSTNFTNLLLAGNSAAYGGGMANYGGGDPEIINATLYGNHAEIAGSTIYNYNSHPQFTNSIVWGNTETNPGPDIVNTGLGPSTTFNSSILEDPLCPGSCTEVLYKDPQFSDPASGDFHLKTTSPAIDAGDVTALPPDIYDLDGDGITQTETIPFDLSGSRRVVVARVDMGAFEAQLWNLNWTEATLLPLTEVQSEISSVEVDRYLDREGQSRWFKFTVQPSSTVIVTLTGLPANYDLTLYKDIAQTFHELNSPQDLVHLSAEFAPDTFSPDTFSPDTFSPDTYSPDTYSPDTFSPDTFSPDTFSPDTFSPDTYSPDTFSPDTFSPDTFSPDTFSPDTYSPDTYSPDTFSPDTFSPDTFSPDTFSSAQTRSLIAVSAHESTQSEGIRVNTWTRSGEFYVRVRGRNGAYDFNNPFHLQIMLLTGECSQVSSVFPASNTTLPGGNYKTLILTNPDKIEGTSDQKTALQDNLNALAAVTNGYVVDVGTDDRVNDASLQAENYPACVYAKNLEAYAVKEIVDRFREDNPLEYIVLVGNDRSIPFFRYPDNALLASESGYSPPVRDNTTSQASLKMGYFLTQDTYGASIELSNKAQTLPIPDLAVGRLVETAADINQVVHAYLRPGGAVIHPTSALVTGYDFLADTANAIDAQLTAGLGPNTVDTLIMTNTLSPEDPSAWTATDLQDSLLGSHHDLVFLAGHFSASTALAADYKTRLTTSDVLNSPTDFTNSLVYSAGCHSGYNIVNAHDVPNVTREPDWAATFAAKGATFIGGTGYQYGDTEFIEYSEWLYLEFTRQLRYGSDPVAVGKALVQAKQAYLASIPVMRGIHEKSLLEATLFGLPMLQVDLQNRTAAPTDETIVTITSTVSSDPGATLGLVYADLSLTPTVTETTVTLDQISPSGGEPTQVTATYLEGPDGVVVNPAEPVLPLDMLNVSYPTNSGFVLRGVGWRGGSYTDLPDRLPLTGAATSDLRAPHPAFFSDTFYPVRPWNINYFDALGSSGGQTRLALMLSQYRSSSPVSLTGTLRQFDAMDFRMYYSSNIGSYTSSDHPSWINTPALAAPPDISHIMSTINEDGTVDFEMTVTGDPSAGIQEVWIVYTGVSGSWYGKWTPLDLVQDPDDSRLWKGTLSIGNNPVEDLRFVVQAVNGVGLVTMMTNQGAYYRAGVDPGAPAGGQTPVVLTLVNPASSGPYGGMATFTALATQNGVPLGDVPITFYLGIQGRLAMTGSNGQAMTSFFLVAQPGDYTLSASFDGDSTYAPANASSSFEIVPGTSSIMLEPAAQQVMYGASLEYTGTVTSAGLPLALKPVALTLEFNGMRLYTSVEVTDYAGRARWQVPTQLPGSYSLTAWFSLPVSAELDLSNPYYTGATSTALLVIYPLNFKDVFSGFFPPVDDPPILNRVKAGSAVPVKFSLGGDFGLDILATGYPISVVSSCQAVTSDLIEETVSAGISSFFYDPLTGQYTYVWKTDKKWAGSCRTLILKFIDGTEKTALFQFTK